MTDDLEKTLEQWGNSSTPSVDGAFANGLETRLRQQIVEEQPRRSALGWLLRPGVLAVAGVLIVVVIGLVATPTEPDPLNVADDNESSSSTALPTTTAPQSTTEVPPVDEDPTRTKEELATIESSIAALTSTTSTPDSATTVAPSTIAPTTTITATSTSTTVAPTTTSTVATAAPPVVAQPITELNAQRDGRQLTISWRVDTTGSDVAGWVLLSEVDGDRVVLETARDPAVRRFVTTIVNVNADYRVEGRNAAGDVVFDSGEILFSPDE